MSMCAQKFLAVYTLTLYDFHIEHITYLYVDMMIWIQCKWYLHSIKMLQFAKEILLVFSNIQYFHGKEISISLKEWG